MEEGEAVAGVDGEERSVCDDLQDSSSVHLLGGVLGGGMVDTCHSTDTGNH